MLAVTVALYSPSISPKVNSSPNSAKVGSMVSMEEIYSPVSILPVSSSPLRLTTGGRWVTHDNCCLLSGVRKRLQHTYPFAYQVFYQNSRGSTLQPRGRQYFTSANTFKPTYFQGDAILFYANYVIHKQTQWPRVSYDWSGPGCSCHETSRSRPMTGTYLLWSDSTSTIRSLCVI